MTHYIAILTENDIGDWRVAFPDFPGCEVKGFGLESAKSAATMVLRRYIDENGSPPSAPMDLATIERNDEWLRQNQIDLSRAVVTLVTHLNSGSTNHMI